ncbi:hypothetical protein PpBr36_02953 [Pyricularia pennisetigena]|uniref:hypothetical protein n=1 Tax=Pyricularia pennisetigena TaxID=1578925 RepID=UPI0011500A66|nr:hypothetical protein PpBr36_02953 [Pyricularia pennisetigena]TLS31218.1 hypothetical protein PpBr36_02953 [Pyricularia pennisetigena]
MLRIVNRYKDRGATGNRGIYTSAPPMSTHGLPPSAVEPGPPLENTILGLVHNKPFPAASSDGRHAYASRPLPHPPSRAKLSLMPPLSNISSGKATTTLRTDFATMDSRISRDDMFLRPATGRAAIDSRRISRDDSYLVGRQQSAWRPGFHIPNRGQLTPDISSRGASPPIFAPPFRRRETPESLRSAEIPIGIGMPIGMAIGSPTQASSHSPPNFSNSWRPQVPQVQEAVRPEPEPRLPPQPEPEPPAPLKRTKTGKRRLFGLFGRKHVEESPMPSPSQSSSFSGLRSASSLQSQRSPTTPMRSHTSAGSSAQKYKPLIARTNTEPMAPAPRSPRRKISNPIPIANSIDTEHPYQPHAFPEVSRQEISRSDISRPEILRPVNPPPPIPITNTGGPFLNVEIPDVKMERYSVMFSGLLNPQSSSSLLARRQATLDRLKSINDCIVKEEEERIRPVQRAATSPQPIPTKSPAFTLFPPTPESRFESSRSLSSPRTRSNTSPATVSSPARQRFGTGSDADNAALGRGQASHKTSHSAGSSRYLHPSARDRPVHFGQGQSSLSLESPTSPASDYERDQQMAVQQPKPTIVVEPRWQLETPPSSAATSSSTASSTRKRSPSSTSSVATNVTRPSVDDESDNALKAAVEISIARQISISRQQRQMLRPLQTSVVRDRNGTTVAGTRPGRPMPSPAKVSPVKLGKNERLQETKSCTPTLIHPPRRHLSPEQLMMHRKSERVILEAA